MKKLLIFVNKFDKNDDLLGFFVGWASELAKHLEKVTIIAQSVGGYEQLSNQHVISINKKQTPSPLARVLKFTKLLWRLRRDYEGTLVIMAPAWAILAALVGKVFKKKTYLWYAVWRGNWKLRLAEKLVDKTFCSVEESFPFKSKKVLPIGQGIDTYSFCPDESKRQLGKVLAFGRISPVKKLEILLEAVSEIKKLHSDKFSGLKIEIAGGPNGSRDDEYLMSLKKMADDSKISEKISWLGRISHSQAPETFQKADIFVNLTPTGSFDKTMLEAMACGDIVLASNRALVGFLPQELSNLLIFKEGKSNDLAGKIKQVLDLDYVAKDRIRKQLREVVIKYHSQKQWAQKLVASL